MTFTPAGHARRQNAIRAVTHLLEQWGANAADQRAAQILDAVDTAGWHPPRDLTHTPPAPAARSTPEGRAAARAALAAALNRDKEPTT